MTNYRNVDSNMTPNGVISSDLQAKTGVKTIFRLHIFFTFGHAFLHNSFASDKPLIRRDVENFIFFENNSMNACVYFHAVYGL